MSRFRIWLCRQLLMSLALLQTLPCQQKSHMFVYPPLVSANMNAGLHEPHIMVRSESAGVAGLVFLIDFVTKRQLASLSFRSWLTASYSHEMMPYIMR